MPTLLSHWIAILRDYSTLTTPSSTPIKSFHGHFYTAASATSVLEYYTDALPKVSQSIITQHHMTLDDLFVYDLMADLERFRLCLLRHRWSILTTGRHTDSRANAQRSPRVTARETIHLLHARHSRYRSPTAMTTTF